MKPARGRPPVVVWVVFFWVLLTSGYTLLSFWLIYVQAVPVSPEVAAYLASRSALDRVGTALVLLLNLGGAVALVMLRKAALGLFSAALVVSLLLTVISVLSRGFLAALGGPGSVGLVVAYVVAIAVCLYVWRLWRRGILA